MKFAILLSLILSIDSFADSVFLKIRCSSGKLKKIQGLYVSPFKEPFSFKKNKLKVEFTDSGDIFLYNKNEAQMKALFLGHIPSRKTICRKKNSSIKAVFDYNEHVETEVYQVFAGKACRMRLRFGEVKWSRKLYRFLSIREGRLVLHAQQIARNFYDSLKECKAARPTYLHR